MFISNTKIIGFDDTKTIKMLDVIISNTPGLAYTKEEEVLEFSMLMKLPIHTGELIHISRYYIATLKGKNLKLEARDENNEPLNYEEEFELVDLH